MARTRKASTAAKRLAVDYTTVSRRISSLETSLGTLLFEKSRTNGFILTAEGQRLLGYAESIESTLHMACEQVSGSGVALSGHVRMGCTEGFGSFFVTPQLSHFVDAYPAISVDILPLPHFISLSSAKPTSSSPWNAPNTARMYAANCATTGCSSTPPSNTWTTTRPFTVRQTWASIRSSVMWTIWRSVRAALPGQRAPRRARASAQHQRDRAIRGGTARPVAGNPAVFLAAQDPRLLPVLPEEITVTRQFWMYCREDLRKLKRITLLWDYIREVTEQNQPLLMGASREMVFAD